MSGFHNSEVSRIVVIFSSVVCCGVDTITGHEWEFLLSFQKGFESGQVINKDPVFSKMVGESDIVNHVEQHGVFFPFLVRVGFQNDGLHSFKDTGFENIDHIWVIRGAPDGSPVGPKGA